MNSLCVCSGTGEARMNMPGMEKTSTDLFVMAGSDAVPPALASG